MANIVVTSDDLAQARTEISSLLQVAHGDDSLLVSCEDLAYQGFDPIYLMAYLRKLGAKAGVTEDVHRKNMITLAVTGTMRGGKIADIIGKSSAAAKAFLSQMQKTYNIISGKPTSNTSVTLLRIAAIYSGVLVTAISQNNMAVRTAVEPEALAPGFPACMCLSTFGSLIPTTNVENEAAEAIMMAFCLHQVLFDQVINLKPENRSSLERITNFVNVQIRSKLYTEADRIKVLVNAGIITPGASGSYVLNPAVSAPMKMAQEKWRALIQNRNH